MEFIYLTAKQTNRFYVYSVQGNRKHHDAPYLYVPKRLRQSLGNPLALRATVEAAEVLAAPNKHTLLFAECRRSSGGARWAYSTEWEGDKITYYIRDEMRVKLGNPVVLKMVLEPVRLTAENVFS